MLETRRTHNMRYNPSRGPVTPSGMLIVLPTQPCNIMAMRRNYARLLTVGVDIARVARQSDTVRCGFRWYLASTAALFSGMVGRLETLPLEPKTSRERTDTAKHTGVHH